MKKNSKSLLKNTIRKIRNNQYKLPLLYEKLEYYEVKMIGYNSPSFEPRYSSSSPSYLSNLDYWLEKVWVVENQITMIEEEIMQYNKFVGMLSDINKNILNGIYEGIKPRDIMKMLSISRNKYYDNLKKIEKSFSSFIAKQ